MTDVVRLLDDEEKSDVMERLVWLEGHLVLQNNPIGMEIGALLMTLFNHIAALEDLRQTSGASTA